jgi:hypothetical protein
LNATASVYERFIVGGPVERFIVELDALGDLFDPGGHQDAREEEETEQPEQQSEESMVAR